MARTHGSIYSQAPWVICTGTLFGVNLQHYETPDYKPLHVAMMGIQSASAQLDVKSILGNLISSDKITIEKISGSWSYSAPAVTFKSSNLLKKAGGAAASSAAEAKARTLLHQSGAEQNEPDNRKNCLAYSAFLFMHSSDQPEHLRNPQKRYLESKLSSHRYPGTPEAYWQVHPPLSLCH